MTKYIDVCEPGQKQRANHIERNDNPTGVIITNKRGNTEQNKERGRQTLADLRETLKG